VLDSKVESFVKICFVISSVIVVGCSSVNKTTNNAVPTTEELKNSNEHVADQLETNLLKVDNLLINQPDPMNLIKLPIALSQGYSEVNRLIAQNEFTQAEDKLKSLQLEHAEFSGPSYRLARIYSDQKKHEKSMRALNEAININPKNYYAFNLKGKILRNAGKFKLAKQAYLQSISIYPSYSNAQLNLAILADIYLYDLKLALNHYQNYQQLTDQTSKKVSGWIIDLKRRMPKEGES